MKIPAGSNAGSTRLVELSCTDVLLPLLSSSTLEVIFVSFPESCADIRFFRS